MKSCHWNNIVIEVHSCLPATPRLQRFGTSKQVLWRKSFTFILFVYHFWSMRLNPRCSGVLRTSIMTIFGGNLKMPILSFFGQGYCRLDTHPRTHLAPPQGNTWGHRWTQGHACGDQGQENDTQRASLRRVAISLSILAISLVSPSALKWLGLKLGHFQHSLSQ